MLELNMGELITKAQDLNYTYSYRQANLNDFHSSTMCQVVYSCMFYSFNVITYMYQPGEVC